MKILEWFCRHKWFSHAIKIYEWEENKEEYSETIEILICEKCGKIHKLEY